MQERGADLGAVAVGRWYAPALAGTTLIGAFLLFQVQPLISKAILPWFGGSPAVWTTCMLFFQVLLFVGYLYAHITTRYLATRVQVALHLGLLAAALGCLPIVPDAGWKPVDGSDPTWRILALLAASVGLPYLVLATTGPLVQTWFGRAYPSSSPYRLYALSNAGSLAALLSYPFLVEPALVVERQATCWAWGLVVYAVLCGVAVARTWRLPALASSSAARPGDEAEPAPGSGRRLLWLTLPACASTMLLAATNHACRDVATIPFLWVFPLSLYLVSFIICFDHERWYHRRFFGTLAAVTTLAVAGIEPLEAVLGRIGFNPTYVHELILYFTALFAVCMVCHGELVRSRPGPRRLTEFYLMIAAGGALGGLGVSLLAPAAFSTYLEWPIGLALGFAIAVAVLTGTVADRLGRRRVVRLVGAGAGLVGLALLSYWQVDDARPLAIARNFYGVVSVWDADSHDPESARVVLLHGRVTHGRQFLDPEKRALATTYYGEESGVGRAIAYLSHRPRLRIGAVGLGAGTLATYARPGDTIRFYELNPVVRDLASRHFTFLDDCRGDCEVIMGDARVSLERQPAQRYDLLVLDAFSGDAIPTHLLTVEAFETYLRHLKGRGVLAVHITNHYLNLAPLVERLARQFALRSTRVVREGEPERLTFHSDWLLLTRDDAFVAANPSVLSPDTPPDIPVPLWTDGYSNLFQILLSD